MADGAGNKMGSVEWEGPVDGKGAVILGDSTGYCW